jgi:3-mercaptopyruvate sulfurtransferase SseA
MTSTLGTTLLFLVWLLSAGAFGAGPQNEDISSPKLRIEWAEFKQLYDEKKIEVIDVRDSASFEAGHIPGSRSIPLDDVAKRIEALKKLKKPIVTYCA